MHIPDGPLSPSVCAVAGGAAAVAVGYSLHQLRESVADRTIPITGMMSAVIFAGQMVNFPLIGTSGHLLGGVLAAVVVGPWAGCLALTAVLFVQCLLFGDGGLLALGANVLHMGVVGAIGGYCVFRVVQRLCGGGHKGTVIGAIVASWCSVMAGAALFCLEFRLSHAATDFDFRNILALMVSVHSLIGVGEAVITGLIVSFLLRQRPDLIPTASETPSAASPHVLGTGLVLALAIAAFLAPFASELPDGFEAVAQRTGFDALESSDRHSLLDGYGVPGLDSWQGLSVALSGLVGTTLVFAISVAFGRVVSRTARRPSVSSE